MGTTSYAIALGSNRRHGRHGAPRRVVVAAIEALTKAGICVRARSKIRATAAMGGAGRGFANAAVLADADLGPDALLATLKAIEREFGRRSGRRWAARVLDLDLIFRVGPVPHRRTRRLTLPHPGLATRAFVLDPLADVAPRWRHPRTGRTVRQMRARLRRARPRPDKPVDPPRRGP